MQKYYPEIYFPTNLKEFNKNWKLSIESKLQPLIPSKPIEPKYPEKPEFEITLLIGPPIIYGIFIYTFFKSFNVLLFLSVTWLLGYTLAFLTSSFKFPKKIKEYKTAKEEYEILFKQFKEKIEICEVQKNRLKDQLNDIQWSYKKRLEFTNEIIKPIKKADIYFKNIKVGRSEKQFENYLNEIFGKAIKKNFVIEIFSYHKYDDFEHYDDYQIDNIKNKKDNAYVADFVFEHPISNLIIDIEIDEPYSLTNIPIHTYGSIHDEKRNQYFIQKNWIVIRFSEEQILNNPYSCCKEIAVIVLDLTGDLHYLNLLKNWERIYRHKKWNYSEALNFSELKTRDKIFDKSNTKGNGLFKNILGRWIRNGKIYEIDEDGLIIEKSNSTITDKGIYKKITTTDGRLILDIHWTNSKTKYIIESCDKETLIWTDLYTREYVDFLPI